MKIIRIGTRDSKLALWQASYIREKLSAIHVKNEFQIVPIKTEGDLDQKSSLTDIGGQGIFTKAIENALLDNQIDLAVHSMKDLPSHITDDLLIAAVPERGNTEDILVTNNGCSLSELKEKAVIGTGSMRRGCQLLHFRKDFIIKDLRGNIETRLRKLKEDQYDGIIMAKAAFVRLDFKDLKYSLLLPEIMIPAVGQGAIAVEIRKEDKELKKMVAFINHSPSYLAVQAERAFLQRLDIGCRFPAGAIAEIKNNDFTIEGFTGSEDGFTILRDKISAPPFEAVKLGVILAEKLITRGALKVLSGKN
jgi:hydroxymethylbilane synthase